MASTSFTATTEKRLALAGNPGDLRVADWLGIKAVGAIVGGVLFALLFLHHRRSWACRRSCGWR